MANFSVTSSASFTLTGITPGTGLPTSSDKVSATYTGVASTADDRVAATFVVNAATNFTPIDLGKIISGKALWLEVDGPIDIKLTQDYGTPAVLIPALPSGLVVNQLRIEKFHLLQSGFTTLEVANPSATTAVHLSVVVAGDRAPVGGGAGVF